MRSPSKTCKIKSHLESGWWLRQDPSMIKSALLANRNRVLRKEFCKVLKRRRKLRENVSKESLFIDGACHNRPVVGRSEPCKIYYGERCLLS